MQGTCFKIRWFVCSRYLQRIPAPADLQMKRATVVAKGKSCSESVSRYYRKTSTQFWEQGYVYRGKQGGKTTYIASFETHVSVGGGGGGRYTHGIAAFAEWRRHENIILF